MLAPICMTGRASTYFGGLRVNTTLMVARSVRRFGRNRNDRLAAY